MRLHPDEKPWVLLLIVVILVVALLLSQNREGIRTGLVGGQTVSPTSNVFCGCPYGYLDYCRVDGSKCGGTCLGEYGSEIKCGWIDVKTIMKSPFPWN